MTPFLPLEDEALIARLKAPHTLFGFDFDGTLSPLVPHHEHAGMRDETRRLFAALCEVAHVVVITGRNRADCLSRLGPARVRAVVGNHGLELGSEPPFDAALLDGARAALGALVERGEGLELEDKRYSLSVHLHAGQPALAVHTAVRHLVGQLSPPLRIVAGKNVVNVVPASAPHKGDALRALMRHAESPFALYVGDDVTDEDVFAAGPPEQLASIRIGANTDKTAARYFLPEQTDIDALLLALVTLRS